ncbi:MAG: class I SAM-dependent methyltransferase [Pirellulaceae bacterium]
MPHEHNRRAWDDRVRDRQRFTRPASDQEFADPLKTVDGVGWLGGDIRGRRLLCLAAGGGRQGPLYAAAGAEVTVVDISPEMLRLDREVAAERRLDLKTVEASMDDLTMFAAAQFDIVVHPVSTCYVPDIAPVYREVARVMRAHGVYISQHKQPTSLQASLDASPRGYELIEPYYRQGPLPQVAGSRLREEGTLEYLHRWEQLLGLMCRSGFVIEDLIEPVHADKTADKGAFGHRCRYIAPYVRIKARRTNTQADRGARGVLWTP